MENFQIPSHKSEIFADRSLTKSDIIKQLEAARSQCKTGPSFILEHCTAYLNVVIFEEMLDEAALDQAFEVLNRALKMLNESLPATLKSLDDDTRSLNFEILKRLTYCYAQIVILYDQKTSKSTKSRSGFFLDRCKVINLLQDLAQKDIKLLWEPPIVEEAYVNLLSDVVYHFLQDPSIKSEKDTLNEIWSFLGLLMFQYNHCRTFVIRIVQLVKLHEHLPQPIAFGLKQIFEKYNCKSTMSELVQEITEWQCEGDQYEDQKGVRNCGALLVELGVNVPKLMADEFEYLKPFLYYEAPVLRQSILAAYAEVIAKVLSHHNLTDEERETRDEIYETMIYQITDKNVTVRAKLIGHWSRLQEENAIPMTTQITIMREALPHLLDVAAAMRKAVCHLFKTMLSSNPFAAELSLSKYRERLAGLDGSIEELVRECDQKVEREKVEYEAKWNERTEEYEACIESVFSSFEAVEESTYRSDNVIDSIAKHLEHDRFGDAAKVCRYNWDHFDEFLKRDENRSTSKLELVMALLKDVYFKKNIVDREMVRIGELREERDHVRLVVEYLEPIDSAVDKITDLFQSKCVTDMQEAISFAIVAYKFKIDKNDICLREMMKLMRRPEAERKDPVVQALKSIYLTTDAKDRDEHSRIIVRNLIEWVKRCTYSSYRDVVEIVSRWARDGELDNYVVQTLWYAYSGRVDSTDEDRIAVLELLRMAALKRPTIVTKNRPMLQEFFKLGDDVDMRMVASFCRAFAIIGHQNKVGEDSAEPVKRLDCADDIYRTLADLLVGNMRKKVPNFVPAITEIINCIYKTCNKPEKVCEELIQRTIREQKGAREREMPVYVLIRWCTLLGDVVRNHLIYLDIPVYWELKRRNKKREDKNTEKKKEKKKRATRRSALDFSNASAANATMDQSEVMQGAEGVDTDADFILDILENETVTGSGYLGQLDHVFVKVCENLPAYSNPYLRGAAVIALMRYMLVSSVYCRNRMQLLFTILAKVDEPATKSTILMHLHDLITRFPNIVDPWMPKVYECLGNENSHVKLACIDTLRKLILKDLIRPRGHIADLAKCLVDKDKDVRDETTSFFESLAKKEDNLYNHLPDVFSHLETMNLPEEDFETIMKFLFGLIDKQKLMEGLVDSFCCKLEAKDNLEFARRVVFCLALITYNDKSLRKLMDNFHFYRHLLDDSKIYIGFKKIMEQASKAPSTKADMKALVAEFDQLIGSVFKLQEGDETKEPLKRPVVKKQTRRGKKQNKRRARSSSSDSN